MLGEISSIIYTSGSKDWNNCDFKPSCCTLLPLHLPISSYLRRAVGFILSPICTVTKHTHTVLRGDYSARLSLVRTNCCIVSNALEQLRKV